VEYRQKLNLKNDYTILTKLRQNQGQGSPKFLTYLFIMCFVLEQLWTCGTALKKLFWTANKYY